jgi:hypothetical protein
MCLHTCCLCEMLGISSVAEFKLTCRLMLDTAYVNAEVGIDGWQRGSQVGGITGVWEG